MISLQKIRSLHAFEDFTDQELELLISAGTARTWLAGQDLCVQGELGAECFVLLEGSVDVIKMTAAGATHMATLGPGTIVGQLALVGRGRRTATLRAAQTVVAILLDRATYEHLLAACSPVALRFQRLIAVSCIRQLRHAVSKLSDVLDTPHEAPRSKHTPTTLRRVTPLPRPSPRDAVQRYLESTAEELHGRVEDLSHVSFVREEPPKTKGPR